MKIKDPVPEIPGKTGKFAYQSIYAAAMAMKPGEWLPVECSDSKERKRISAAVRQKGFRLRTSGNTVFFQKIQ